MADPNIARQLKIKSGIVRRYVKEYHYYEREAQKQVDKIQEMKTAAEVDEYAVKKAQEVLQETRSMIPITSANVRKYAQELRQLIDAYAEALKGSAELAAAQEDLASTEGIN